MGRGLIGSKPCSGFTLVELITVIIVLGVVSVGISGFIRSGLSIYNDVTERDQLLSESRFVVERLNRELRMAVPNSARLAQDSDDNQCLEFVPADWVTYYTRLPVFPDVLSTVNIVAIAGNTANFSLALDGSDYALVYPNSNADVYDLTRNKRRVINDCLDQGDDTSCTSDDDPNNLAQLTVSGVFADFSPASRLYFVDRAVSYCAVGRNIYRLENPITALQTVYTAGDLMAENQRNNLPFQVVPATLTRNGLVNMLLTFERNDEIVNFSHEVHIPNVP